MDEKKIKELKDQGWVHARAIIEIVGKPKKHVEDTMKGVLQKAKEEDDLEVTSEEIAEVTENEGFFQTFAEVEILCKTLPVLYGFCFDYLPSSIEIFHPETMPVNMTAFAQMLNEIQTRLHKSDLAVKNLRAENNLVQANFDAMLKNLLIMSLRSGDKSMEELAAHSGVKTKFLQTVVRLMMKQKLVTFDGKTVALSARYKRLAEDAKKESAATPASAE